ncbi:MAG: hypothetical protein KJ666_16675 [Bacteroidetes bacterium]|nr:hypothetical protein [Bacteroidota bacterium]
MFQKQTRHKIARHNIAMKGQAMNGQAMKWQGFLSVSIKSSKSIAKDVLSIVYSTVQHDSFLHPINRIQNNNHEDSETQSSSKYFSEGSFGLVILDKKNLL